MAKKNTSEKFVSYEDAEMEELKKIISEFVEDFKREFAPALNMVLPETVERHTNKFLREKRAEFLADQQAISEGYKDLADKYLKQRIEREDKEAAEIAAQKAIERAKQEEEAKILADQIEAEKVAKALRDEEDAKKVADLKAKIKAGEVADSSLDLTLATDKA